MVELKDLYAANGLEMPANELPDYLPLFLEFLSTRPLGRGAGVPRGHRAYRDRARGSASGRRRRSIYAEAFAAIETLAGVRPDRQDVEELLERPDDDPNDLAAIDRVWEEEPVTFGGPGPDASASCGPDRVAAQIRAGRRPPPDPGNGAPGRRAGLLSGTRSERGGDESMAAYLDTLLFGIYPYVALAVLVVGSIVRYDREPYTWRSGSSQILRRRQLIVGSVLFHVGVIIVFLGHLVGLLTPIQVFDALGIGHGFKQIMAIVVGGRGGARGPRRGEHARPSTLLRRSRGAGRSRRSPTTSSSRSSGSNSPSASSPFRSRSGISTGRRW